MSVSLHVCLCTMWSLELTEARLEHLKALELELHMRVGCRMGANR